MKFKATRQSEWFVNPKMAGHTWAKNAVVEAEAIVTKWSKTKLQKQASAYILPECDVWNFWCNDVSKSHLAKLRWVLKRLTKETVKTKGGVTSVLRGYEHRAGIMKTRIHWFLEALAYKHDREAYLASYQSAFGFYGLSKDEAEERFTEYNEKLVKKVNL